MRRIVAIGNVLYVYLILGMLAMIFGSNTPTGMLPYEKSVFR